jgi:hypothetical protein
LSDRFVSDRFVSDRFVSDRFVSDRFALDEARPLARLDRDPRFERVAISSPSWPRLRVVLRRRNTHGKRFECLCVRISRRCAPGALRPDRGA